MTEFNNSKGKPMTVQLRLEDLMDLTTTISVLKENSHSLLSSNNYLRQQCEKLEEDLASVKEENAAQYQRDEKHRDWVCAQHIQDRQELYEKNERLLRELEEYRYGKGEYIVVLESYGLNKISCIRWVREYISDPTHPNQHLGLGLKEAKDLVESAPIPLATNMNKISAEKLLRKLREIGATANLYNWDNRVDPIVLPEDVVNLSPSPIQEVK